MKRIKLMSVLAIILFALPIYGIASSMYRPSFAAKPGTDTIVFQSLQLQGYGPQLYIVGAGGEDPTRLTYNTRLLLPWLPLPSFFGQLVSNTNPMYSPGDGRIVFLSNLEGPNKLYSIDPDGSDQKSLPVPLENINYTAMSSDGTKIAYKDMRSQINITDLSGSSRICVTCSFNERTNNFIWSPDSTKLAISISRGSKTSIHIINADGTNLVQVTSWGHYIDSISDWSPDGQKLLFSSNRQENSSQIYSINIDGSDLQQLTNTKPPSGLVIGNTAPVWSPDGQRIAFTSSRDGQSDIYVMNADGTNQTRLTTTGKNYHPIWVPIR